MVPGMIDCRASLDSSLPVIRTEIEFKCWRFSQNLFSFLIRSKVKSFEMEVKVCLRSLLNNGCALKTHVTMFLYGIWGSFASKLPISWSRSPSMRTSEVTVATSSSSQSSSSNSLWEIQLSFLTESKFPWFPLKTISP